MKKTAVLMLLLILAQTLFAQDITKLNSWVTFQSTKPPVKFINPDRDAFGILKGKKEEYRMALGSGIDYCEKIEGFPVCPIPEPKRIKLSSLYPFLTNHLQHIDEIKWREGEVSEINVPGIVDKPQNTKGLQISGLGSNVVENVKGVNIGVYNRTYESITGIQLGIAEREETVQLGTLSSTPKISGVQVGIINYSSEKHGVQLGFANIIYEGENPLFPVLSASFPF